MNTDHLRADFARQWAKMTYQNWKAAQEHLAKQGIAFYIPKLAFEYEQHIADMWAFEKAHDFYAAKHCRIEAYKTRITDAILKKEAERMYDDWAKGAPDGDELMDADYDMRAQEAGYLS